MLDRFGFEKDLEELRADGDPCKVEYYLNQRFMELKDGCEDGQCCCYGYFQGGEATAEFEELLRRDKENKKKADIVLVLDELEKHYAQYKPELVAAVHSVKESYKSANTAKMSCKTAASPPGARLFCICLLEVKNCNIASS